MDKIDKLEKIISKSSILLNEPMKQHTTFKIGGPAEIFINVGSFEELKNVVNFCNREEIDFFVLGKGSNLLVSDEGIKGVIIHLTENLAKAEVNKKLFAGAGISLSELSYFAAENGLSGLEFASGIPGTLGGAIFMNAGAYGGEIKDVIEGVYVLVNGGLQYFTNSEMKFSYRHSRISELKKAIVVAAKLNLSAGSKEEIFATMKDLNQRRRDKQPLEFPSAGSTFKRPERGYASKLIEEAGLKGMAVGDAAVSVRHGGFIINKGNATANDVKKLIKIVQDKVEKSTGIKLYPEVRFL